jgi:hypothetical protein
MQEMTGEITRTPKARQAVTSKTVIEHVLGRLREIGIKDIFGVPGDFAFPIQDAVCADQRLRLDLRLFTISRYSRFLISLVRDQFASLPSTVLMAVFQNALELAEKAAGSIGLMYQFQGESFLRPGWHGSSNTHLVEACDRLRGRLA